MWGWFSPKCPLDTWEKTWTETRMRWLAEQFGIERMLRAKVVLPTDEFFPEAYSGTPADAQRVMEQFRAYMGVVRNIRLAIVPDDVLPGAAGEYIGGDRVAIRVAESQLENPQRLFATLTHELAHELLLGEGRLTAETPDHEQITDLLLAFLGVGVFAANTTVFESSFRDGRYYSWTVGKEGYLPARTFGYAMALFAWLRNERKPAWAKHLRLDASTALWQGLRYLQRTGDSVFQRESTWGRSQTCSAGELRYRLQTGSATVRMETLWELQNQTSADLEIVAEVTRLLDDSDRDLPSEAARTLRLLGPLAASASPALVGALRSPHETTRIEAAQALGSAHLRTPAAILELGELLDDSTREVVQAAAQALAQYGAHAGSVSARLLAAFSRALKDCHTATLDILADALLATTSEPENLVARYFAEDEELQSLAMEALRERRKSVAQLPG